MSNISNVQTSIMRYFANHPGKHGISDIMDSYPQYTYYTVKHGLNMLKSSGKLRGKRSSRALYWVASDLDDAFKLFFTMKPTETGRYRHR